MGMPVLQESAQFVPIPRRPTIDQLIVEAHAIDYDPLEERKDSHVSQAGMVKMPSDGFIGNEFANMHASVKTNDEQFGVSVFGPI